MSRENSNQSLDNSNHVIYSNKMRTPSEPLLPTYNKTVHEQKTLSEMALFPLEYLESKFSAGSIKGSIFTLMTATVGAGILALPNAIAVSGIALGCFFIVGCSFLGYYSTFLLVKAGEKGKQYSYQTLAILAYGKKFELFVKIVFFINNWGTCVIYTILINQLIIKALSLFAENSLPIIMTDSTVSYFWPPIFTTLIIFPISLFRELTSLRYFCLLGFGFILFLAFAIAYEMFNPIVCDLQYNLDNLALFDLSGLTTTIPTAIFAYMCHPNVLDVYHELQRPSKRRMSKVLSREMALVMLIYLCVGVTGYITFATNLSGMGGSNVLYGDYHNQLLITLAILFIGFSVIIASPLNVKPAKDSLRDIIFPYNIQNVNAPENKDSNLRHFILVFAVTYSQMIAGIVFNNIGTVINILGSSANPMICFIFPCIFFLKLDDSPPTSFSRIICIILLVVMILFGFYSTISVFIQTFSSSSSSSS